MTNNSLTSKAFEFCGSPLRVVCASSGDPWFLASDVCAHLEYANARQALTSHVEPEDRGVRPMDTPGGVQNLNVVNESGLYSLIFGSRKPGAKRFKRWVTQQVLPEIRKTGSFQPASQFQVPSTLSGALRLAAEQAECIESQQRQIEESRPAVEFVERFVESRSAKSLREVAKVLGFKERDFITRLVDERILFRQSGSLLPFAQYHHRGYFEVKTGESQGHAYQQTRFTPEGIAWVAKRFGLIRKVA
ncbi:BRO family protein [Marinobacter sp. 1Y8]